MSLHSKKIQTSDRGCVGDQPQKRLNSDDVNLGSASRDSDLLRLVSDTAAIRLFQPVK
jgi:hypothetical protein